MTPTSSGYIHTFMSHVSSFSHMHRPFVELEPPSPLSLASLSRPTLQLPKLSTIPSNTPLVHPRRSLKPSRAGNPISWSQAHKQTGILIVFAPSAPDHLSCADRDWRVRDRMLSGSLQGWMFISAIVLKQSSTGSWTGWRMWTSGHKMRCLTSWAGRLVIVRWFFHVITNGDLQPTSQYLKSLTVRQDQPLTKAATDAMFDYFLQHKPGHGLVRFLLALLCFLL
jgi:hypothetical protein